MGPKTKIFVSSYLSGFIIIVDSIIIVYVIHVALTTLTLLTLGVFCKVTGTQTDL